MAFKIDHTPWGLVTAADTANGYLRGANDARVRRESSQRAMDLATYGQDRMDQRAQMGIDAKAQEAELARQNKALEDGDLSAYLGDVYGAIEDPANQPADGAPVDYMGIALSKAKTPKQSQLATTIGKHYSAQDLAAKKGVEAQLKAAAEKKADEQYAKAMGGQGGAAPMPVPAGGADGQMGPMPIGAGLEQSPEQPMAIEPNMEGWAPTQVSAYYRRQDQLKRDADRKQLGLGRGVADEEVPQAKTYLKALRDPNASEDFKDEARLWLRRREALPLSEMVERQTKPESDPIVRVAWNEYRNAGSELKAFQAAQKDPMAAMQFREAGVTQASLQAKVDRAMQAYLDAHASATRRAHQGVGAPAAPAAVPATPAAPAPGAPKNRAAELDALLGP